MSGNRFAPGDGWGVVSEGMILAPAVRDGFAQTVLAALAQKTWLQVKKCLNGSDGNAVR